MKATSAFYLCSLCLLCLGLAFPSFASSPGQVDLSFRPGSGINGSIQAMAAEADGKILIGGAFTTVRGADRNRIARLNEDGGADVTFDPGTGPNGDVRAVALQPDHKVLIAGHFISVNGMPRSRIARLNEDGSLDSSFDPGAGANTNVTCLALQPDGKVLIAGPFTSVNGTPRNYIARLNADGSLDTGFSTGTGPNGEVSALTLQPDGKVVIGGRFLTINGISRYCIARLNPDGSLDTGFNSDSTTICSSVYSVALQLDGKMVVGGYVGPSCNPLIPRLNSDGTPDRTFTADAGACHSINCVAVQADSQVLIAGSFVLINGTNALAIARLKPDGNLDATFQLNCVGVACLLPLDNGKLLIAGDFTSVNGASRAHLAQVNADGTLDASFNPGTEAGQTVINAIAAQPDGKILIGGDFTWLEGIEQGHIARLNRDGSLDRTFNSGAGANGSVTALFLLPDGKVLLGGEFTSVNGVSCQHIAQLNQDGSLDTNFNAAVEGPIYSVNRLPDGRLLIAGYEEISYGTIDGYMCRLHADGRVDNTFQAGVTLCPRVAVAVQADGKMLVGSSFSGGMVRLNPDGSEDTLLWLYEGPYWRIYGTVNSIALQPDGKMLLAGSFAWVNLAGSRKDRSLLRFLPDGTLDPSFDMEMDVGSRLSSVKVLADGKLLLAGDFTLVNGTPCAGIARLNPDGTLDTSFNPGIGQYSVSVLELEPDGNILVVAGSRWSTSPPVWALRRLFAATAPPVFSLGPVTRLPNGSPCLSIIGDSVLPCRLEAASTLNDPGSWVPLTSLTNTTGRLLYIDRAATNFSRRFYRLGWNLQN